MKIVIVGAGIAGCTAYLQLSKHLPGHEVTIYEPHSTDTPTGMTQAHVKLGWKRSFSLVKPLVGAFACWLAGSTAQCTQSHTGWLTSAGFFPSLLSGPLSAESQYNVAEHVDQMLAADQGE
jgi:hypothetical protein